MFRCVFFHMDLSLLSICNLFCLYEQSLKLTTSYLRVHWWLKHAGNYPETCHCVQSMLEDWKSWNMMLMEDSGRDSSSSISTTHWRRKAADKQVSLPFPGTSLYLSCLLEVLEMWLWLGGQWRLSHITFASSTLLEENKGFQLSCPEQDNIPHTDHVPQRRKEKPVLVNVNYRRTALV